VILALPLTFSFYWLKQLWHYNNEPTSIPSSPFCSSHYFPPELSRRTKIIVVDSMISRFFHHFKHYDCHVIYVMQLVKMYYMPQVQN
jgi:hypothetical protein